MVFLIYVETPDSIDLKLWVAMKHMFYHNNNLFSFD